MAVAYCIYVCSLFSSYNTAYIYILSFLEQLSTGFKQSDTVVITSIVLPRPQNVSVGSSAPSMRVDMRTDWREREAHASVSIQSINLTKSVSLTDFSCASSKFTDTGNVVETIYLSTG